VSRLWDKGEPLDARILRYTAGEDHALDDRLVAYDVTASIAHAACCTRRAAVGRRTCEAIVGPARRWGACHAAANGRSALEEEDATRRWKPSDRRVGEAGGRIHLGRSRNDQVLTALRLYLLDAVERWRTAPTAWPPRSTASRRARATWRCPATPTCSRPCQARWRCGPRGFASEFRDDAEACATRHRRIGTNPLGSAAGYGVPGLPLDRAATRALGFAEVHEPVTAVQLSRGKAEASCSSRSRCCCRTSARLAADLMLFYTQEFAFVSLPESMTTGSSIMPQKRNPDVFELLRGARGHRARCLNEALGIVLKLTSGYHRDLQRLKAPLFRGIDLAGDSLAIAAVALEGVASGRRTSGCPSNCTRRSARMPWCWPKASPSAKPIAGRTPRYRAREHR
jgi:argininosuccinate lyase